MWHPTQKVFVNPHTPVELKFDNWVESQLEVGLIVEVE